MLLEFLQTFLASLSFLYLLFHSFNNFMPPSSIAAVALIFSLTDISPSLSQPLGTEGLFSLSAGILLSGAVLKGLLLALPCFLSIEMASSGTRLVDLLRGAMIAEQLSPVNNSRVSQLESIMRMGFLLIFIRSEHFARLLIELFKVPSISGFHGITSGGFGGVSQAVIGLLQTVSLKLLLVYAPIIFLIALLELAALWAARLFPKINLSQELATLRLLVGSGLFFLVLEISPESLNQLLVFKLP